MLFKTGADTNFSQLWPESVSCICMLDQYWQAYAHLCMEAMSHFPLPNNLTSSLYLRW
jgi:hypothetical protein